MEPTRNRPFNRDKQEPSRWEANRSRIRPRETSEWGTDGPSARRQRTDESGHETALAVFSSQPQSGSLIQSPLSITSTDQSLQEWIAGGTMTFENRQQFAKDATEARQDSFATLRQTGQDMRVHLADHSREQNDMLRTSRECTKQSIKEMFRAKDQTEIQFIQNREHDILQMAQNSLDLHASELDRQLERVYKMIKELKCDAVLNVSNMYHTEIEKQLKHYEQFSKIQNTNADADLDRKIKAHQALLREQQQYHSQFLEVAREGMLEDKQACELWLKELNQKATIDLQNKKQETDAQFQQNQINNHHELDIKDQSNAHEINQGQQQLGITREFNRSKEIVHKQQLQREHQAQKIHANQEAEKEKLKSSKEFKQMDIKLAQDQAAAAERTEKFKAVAQAAAKLSPIPKANKCVIM